MISCKKCNGECCKYIATYIDKPKNREDIHHIRWFLCHKNVKICIDDEKDWYIEFITPCKYFGKDKKCKIYDKRPDICRKHGVDECDINGEGDAYEKEFHNVKEFEEYVLQDKRLSKIKWNNYNNGIKKHNGWEFR